MRWNAMWQRKNPTTRTSKNLIWHSCVVGANWRTRSNTSNTLGSTGAILPTSSSVERFFKMPSDLQNQGLRFTSKCLFRVNRDRNLMSASRPLFSRQRTTSRTSRVRSVRGQKATSIAGLTASMSAKFETDYFCPAASRIRAAIVSGCDISARWLAFTSIVFAPMRFAMNRSRSGLIVRSSVETA